MEKSFPEKVLEILQAGTETTVDLFDILTSGYGESYRKARRGMTGRGGFHFKTDWAAEYKEQQVFYSLLNRMKREGFIVKDENKKGSLWRITSKGLDRFSLFRKKSLFSTAKLDYVKESSPRTTLVIFDIPEKEHSKRVWLHSVLRLLGFSLIQQSVWAGKSKIPERFLRDLRDRKMLGYVDILEITRKGTIVRL